MTHNFISIRQIWLVLLCTVLGLNHTFAQQKNKEETVEPALPEVIDFETGKSIDATTAAKTVKEKKNVINSLDYQNLVTINPLGLVFGVAEGGFERSITNHLSVEATGGWAIGSSLSWASSFNTLTFITGKTLEDRANNWDDKEYSLDYTSLPIPFSTASPRALPYKAASVFNGSTIGLNVRYYVMGEEAFHGLAIGLHTRYSAMSSTISDVQPSHQNPFTGLNGKTVSTTVFDIGPILTYRLFKFDRFVITPEAHFGYRSLNHKGYDLAYQYTTQTYKTEPVDISYTGFYYNAALRIGYMF